MSYPSQNFGAYRFKITFQIPSTVRAADGQQNPDDSWTDYATRWANVEPLQPGREYVWANQIAADCNVKITCRYLAGITAEMRIVHGDHIYQLAGPPIDQDNMKTV